jgi:hypothetical protein
MKFARSALFLTLFSCLAWAQDPEASSLGLQLMASFPEAGLADAVGNSGLKLPGLGANLVVEMDLTEGYRVRGVMGGDRWDTGDWSGRPGIEGKVSDFHLGLEGVMMLRPDESPSWGPYIVGGISGYAWSVDSHDKTSGVSSTRRILHVAGTFGIGFRLAKCLDVELRGLGGGIDPGLFAAAVQLGVTYRY